MTLDKDRELLQVQAGFGGFYNANSVKLILAEVRREHGQAAVDALIRECRLKRCSVSSRGRASMAGSPSSRTENNDYVIVSSKRFLYIRRLPRRAGGVLKPGRSNHV